MRWIELADGVYARRYRELDQTLGLVVGGTRCLVVDTGPDEVHGAEWAAAIREITPLPWSIVITHAHWDHFLGTAPFGDADVWSHPGCRAGIVADAGRQAAEWAAKYRDNGLDELADRVLAARVVLPTLSVADRVDLDLGGRVATLTHLARGHTDHDVVVHVPDAEVVFAGDVVEQGAPPYIGAYSDTASWPTLLDRLLELGPRVVVPGHGEPVEPGYVRGQRAELATVASLVEGVRSGELSVAEASAQAPYPPETLRAVLEAARP